MRRGQFHTYAPVPITAVSTSRGSGCSSCARVLEREHRAHLVVSRLGAGLNGWSQPGKHADAELHQKKDKLIEDANCTVAARRPVEPEELVRIDCVSRVGVEEAIRMGKQPLGALRFAGVLFRLDKLAANAVNPIELSV